jgi:DNA replication ATP-dependent helicase Dna2
MKIESKRNSKLYVNYCEIAIVLHIVDLLIKSGVQGESIGIMAPYRDQVEALKKVFASHKNVEVNTVDQYQGRDKKIIIYSCTLSETTSCNSKSSSEVEILEDRRRLTVAITRAKNKLIMVGDVNCLNKYTPFRDLFKCMCSMSKTQVQDDKLGFSWSKIMQPLKMKISEG